METIDSLYNRMLQTLTPKFGRGEAREIVRLIFLDLKGWDASAIIVNGNLSVSDYLEEKVNEYIGRIMHDEPVQYVAGKAHFHGLTFDVAPGVLIPRPETSQLVDIIVDTDSRPDQRVLDLCSGSGCIAISLARALPFAHVTGVEVSAPALEIAKKNAASLKADVRFIKADIFKWEPEDDEKFDVLVSNPPYIDLSEALGMDKNVLDYEPHSALFVSDDDPLVFYRRIAVIALRSLERNGRLYLEINPRHAAELKEVLEKDGLRDVEIIKDFRGCDRFIMARRIDD